MYHQRAICKYLNSSFPLVYGMHGDEIEPCYGNERPYKVGRPCGSTEFTKRCLGETQLLCQLLFYKQLKYVSCLFLSSAGKRDAGGVPGRLQASPRQWAQAAYRSTMLCAITA